MADCPGQRKTFPQAIPGAGTAGTAGTVPSGLSRRPRPPTTVPPAKRAEGEPRSVRLRPVEAVPLVVDQVSRGGYSASFGSSSGGRLRIRRTSSADSPYSSNTA